MNPFPSRTRCRWTQCWQGSLQWAQLLWVCNWSHLIGSLVLFREPAAEPAKKPLLAQARNAVKSCSLQRPGDGSMITYKLRVNSWMWLFHQPASVSAYSLSFHDLLLHRDSAGPMSGSRNDPPSLYFFCEPDEFCSGIWMEAQQHGTLMGLWYSLALSDVRHPTALK